MRNRGRRWREGGHERSREGRRVDNDGERKVGGGGSGDGRLREVREGGRKVNENEEGGWERNCRKRV